MFNHTKLRTALTLIYIGLYRSLPGTKAKVYTIKAADFVALKTMKNVPAPLKLSLISACVLTEAIVVDSTSEATAKKMVYSKQFTLQIVINMIFKNYYMDQNQILNTIFAHTDN